MEELKKLLIVDGYRVIARIYHSLPLTVNKQGRHTNALQGLLYVLRQQTMDEADAIYFVFGNKEELRTPLYQAGYLQQSQYPDALLEQLEYIFDLLEAAGIPVLRQESVSSGALIHTLLQRTEQEQLAVKILTSDETLLCLADDRVEVVLPQVKDKSFAWTAFDIAKIQEQYRHMPSKENMLRSFEAEVMTDFAVDFKQAEQYDLSDTAVAKVLTAVGVPEEGAATADKPVKKNQSKASWSYRIEKVKNTSQADTIWHACMEEGTTGLQVFTIKNQENTQLLAAASGQMYLQFGEEKASDTVCVALTNSKYPDTVFWMCSEEALPETYLKDKLTAFLKEGMGTFATFDVKGEYGQMLSEMDTISLDRTERIFDIKIAAYLLNPLHSDYEIQDIASEMLNLKMDAWKDLFGKADIKGAFLEKREEMIAYYAKIAWVSYQTFSLLQKRLAEEEMTALFHEIEMPLTFVLYDMERTGVKIQPEALKQYGDSLQVRISELEQIIYEQAGVIFNINSPKQLGEILFEKMGLPGGKKTKTGYSTAADVLERLSEEYPIVNDILEYRQLTKLKSTYADGLANYIADDGRIHTSFNQTITATGRLSSTEPNLQNIPMRMELGRLIRKVFVPKEGCFFMDADYSQIELRVLAHMSEDHNLIEAYQMSEDIHRITASQVFHTPFEEVTDLQRRNAKAVNFGIVYGISSFGLSQGLSITRQEATEYIERYFETYPGVKHFLDRLVSEAKLSGKSKSMFGRIRPIPELQSRNYMQRQFGERVAMNAPIQGTAADIIKIAMIRVWKCLQEAGLRSRLILQIHDELLIETYEEEKEQVKQILTTQMEEAARLSVALDIDLHIGADWYEAK